MHKLVHMARMHGNHRPRHAVLEPPTPSQKPLACVCAAQGVEQWGIHEQRSTAEQRRDGSSYQEQPCTGTGLFYFIQNRGAARIATADALLHSASLATSR